MKKISFILCFSVLSFALGAQERNYSAISKEDAQKLLQKMAKWYSTTSTYSFTVVHSIYSSHTATVPYEQKAGFFRKLPSGFHSEVVGIKTVQDKNFKVSVDDDRKIMLVSNSEKAGNGFSTEEYYQMLGGCSALKVAAGKDEQVLRLELPKNSPVACYELTMDNEGKLKAVWVWYSREVEVPEGGKVKPRISIVFDKYATGISASKNELNEGGYFTLEKNNIKPGQAYTDYMVLDQRIPDTKP